MKILLVNGHHKMVGGAERYYFELGRLLKSRGHEIAYFSMLDKNNEPSPWKKYFVSNTDPNKTGFKEFIKKTVKIYYSFESKRNIKQLLKDFKPDIVHINNIYYHITGSILPEIKKTGIPIVQTVHDYELLSPNVILYHDGKICEITKSGKYYRSIFHKCVGGSYLSSLVMTLLLYVQNFNDSYIKNVDFLISPSIFMKNKLIDYGLNKKKIIHINNFVNPTKIRFKKNVNKYVLYFGRFTEAKGFQDLINLAKSLPHINFYAAGNFESKQDRNYFLTESKKSPNLKLLGFKNSDELKSLISSCQFVIVPSKWYENQPYSVLESFSMGKPVVAPRIGGLKEIVVNNKTGLLYNYNDFFDFQKTVSKMYTNNTLRMKLSKNALNFAHQVFGPDVHYKNIIKLYKKAIHLKHD